MQRIADPIAMKLETREPWVRTPEAGSVVGFTYNEDARELVVRFISSTAKYRFLDVPRFVYDALLGSDSRGRFINGVVKPNFACEKV